MTDILNVLPLARTPTIDRRRARSDSAPGFRALSAPVLSRVTAATGGLTTAKEMEEEEEEGEYEGVLR